MGLALITEERLRSPFELTLVLHPGAGRTQSQPPHPKWPLSASGFARFKEAVQPPDLRPKASESVHGYGPQLPDWIRSVQTAPKSSLFASGFARFKEAVQPPDLRPDCAEIVAFCIGFCTLQ